MGKAIKIIISLAAWFALGAQYYLMIENRVASIGETTIRYFSFFTILTNLLIAIVFTFEIFKEIRPSVFTASIVYITIVGTVYQMLLRHVWNPTGLQKLVDELLHSIIPLLAIIYWIFVKKKRHLPYKIIMMWAIYPIVYLAYILIRGKFSDFYPYPFVNVVEIGYKQALLNSLFILLGFIIVSVFYVWLNRRLVRSV